MLPSVLKRGCDLQQSSSTASSQTTAQYLFIETRECTVNMKHFAKSQEITTISRPFGEHNHPRWNVSGLRIIRLETVIVHTAFSGFFWRAGRRGGGGAKSNEQSLTSLYRVLTSPFGKWQEIATLQLLQGIHPACRGGGGGGEQNKSTRHLDLPRDCNVMPS